MVNVSCNLCGSDRWRLLLPATAAVEKIDVSAFRCTSPGYGSHGQIVQCKECGYTYVNPRIDADELIGAYDAVEDETYLAARLGRELTFRKHLQALEKQIGPANGRSLLDVGAYVGVFVEVAESAGWQAWGVEPSAWASAQAQRRGLHVIHGTQEADALQDKQFEVITMWDVIEHVDDPSGEMARAYELLQPGGVLVVHTMDIDSLTARVLGKRWPWYMDMHIHYFSRRTMHAMLQKNGFEIVWTGTQGRYLTLDYFASRVRAFHAPLGRLVTAVVNGLHLQAVAVPVNFGDLFTVYARKPGVPKP